MNRPSLAAVLDIRDQKWRDLSACRTADPNLFNPIGQREIQGVDRCRRTAAEFCRRCPVAAACFAAAVADAEVGVWSGHLFRKAGADPEPLLGAPFDEAVAS